MSEPRIIKKYPNRRLYDTVESRYITLSDIRRLVTEKVGFVVIDKKTQEDITRSILLQVISEQEHMGEPLMSQDFLSQVIRSYGSAMQSFVGNYLEQSLKMFQAPPRESPPNGAQVGGHQAGNPMGAPLGNQAPGAPLPDPFTAMANLARQNYERWLTMQSEFLRAMSGPAANRAKDTGTPEAPEPLDDEPADHPRP